jgi:DNA-binding LacI/PurR family transcriptional regulator
LQPSVQGLPWIDRDHGRIAVLAAEHFRARRCRRVVALFRAELGPGDFVLLDWLQQSLAAGGLGLNDFTVRCLPADRRAVASCVLPILQQSKRPLGVLCRSQLLAEGAAAAVEALGPHSGRRVEFFISDVYRKPSDPLPAYPYARSLPTSEEIGQHIGRMLAQQARREVVDPSHEVIPVALEVPK